MRIFTISRNVRVLAVLLFFGIRAMAQTVTIPDPAFAAYLQTQYPSCMTGDQMDITCPDITSEDSLNLVNLNIHSFEGLQYFTSLQVFKGSSNPVGSLPALQQSLLWLCVDSCGLTGLPTLPGSLQYLSLWGNSNLGSLPALPSSLDELHCLDCGLSSLPALPASLSILNCGANSLTQLPTLPNNLYRLFAGNNHLTVLPDLPAGLSALDCSNNQLTSLPTLPADLYNLSAEINQLTALPDLPSSLAYLSVSINPLTALPALPQV